MTRLLAAVGSIACLAAAAWLAWAEWGRGAPPVNAEAARAAAAEVAAGLAGLLDDPVGTARTAVAGRRWEEALRALDQVGPDHDDPDEVEEAASLRARALVERRSRDAFERLQRQVVDGEVAAARHTLRLIPEDSAYRGDAQRIIDAH